LKLDRQSLLLYVVTDRTWLRGKTLASQVEEAVRAGATCIQIREKELGFDEFMEEAKAIKKITDKYGVPLIVNDNVQVALACGADGVHVGQSDMEASQTRKQIGSDKILGVSAQTVEQAILAEKNGADYIGVGAVFSTSTKLDADTVSFEALCAICSAVRIPVVAIGGIGLQNAGQLAGSGIDGIAVISAIFASQNVAQATCALKKLAIGVCK